MVRLPVLKPAAETRPADWGLLRAPVVLSWAEAQNISLWLQLGLARQEKRGVKMPEDEHRTFISFFFFNLPDQLDYYQGYLQLRPRQQFPSGLQYHRLLKAEIICCCWLPCCWTSLHSGRCFCFSQATDSLMAPFLLPPGTPDHLLLSGEAGGTTYTITTLFFRVLPSWHATDWTKQIPYKVVRC